jgi:uncharacterized membrane protein (UPF0127 family)
MRFPIDLIFIDKGKKIVELANLKPWRLYTPENRCKWVLEVKEGFVKKKRLKKDDKISF